MGREFNSSMDLRRCILPKMGNKKVVETSPINSSNNNNKNTSFNISIKKKPYTDIYSTSSTNLHAPKKLPFPPKIKKHLY